LKLKYEIQRLVDDQWNEPEAEIAVDQRASECRAVR